MKKNKYFILTIVLIFSLFFVFLFYLKKEENKIISLEKKLYNTGIVDILPNDDIQKNIENLDNNVDIKSNNLELESTEVIDEEKIQKEKDISICNNV